MQNRQSGRRRRGGSSGGNNPRPMGMASGGQGSANRMEVRVRGNASQLLEKYKVLARDAHQAGDRVATEYYLQHADHYFRVLNDGRIRQEEMRARRGPFDQLEDDYDDDGDAQDAGIEEDDRSQERGGQERGGQERGNQDRNQDQDRNRRPRDDRRPEGRNDRQPEGRNDRQPEGRNDRQPEGRNDRQPRDADRQPRDAERGRWQQDGRQTEGGRDGQRDGQADMQRDYAQRDNPQRDNPQRDNSQRDNGQGRDSLRANGNRHEDDGRARPDGPRADGQRADGQRADGRARPDGQRVRTRQADPDLRGHVEEPGLADANPAGLSDGEAALVAFGGVQLREPVREPARPRIAPDDGVETGAVSDVAPAPRKRGRPRKVDVAPVEG